MVSVLESGSSGLSSSPGQGHYCTCKLCFWVRHFTLTVPLSAQVYKWVTSEFNAGGNPVMD